jgi:hypothetical protein
MELIEITPEEIIALQIENAYLYRPKQNFIESIRFNYQTQTVTYSDEIDCYADWGFFEKFINNSWPLYQLDNPTHKLYIINKE